MAFYFPATIAFISTFFSSLISILATGQYILTHYGEIQRPAAVKLGSWGSFQLVVTTCHPACGYLASGWEKG
jgi:hypothetical protein